MRPVTTECALSGRSMPPPPPGHPAAWQEERSVPGLSAMHACRPMRTLRKPGASRAWPSLHGETSCNFMRVHTRPTQHMLCLLRKAGAAPGHLPGRLPLPAGGRSCGRGAGAAAGAAAGACAGRGRKRLLTGFGASQGGQAGTFFSSQVREERRLGQEGEGEVRRRRREESGCRRCRRRRRLCKQASKRAGKRAGRLKRTCGAEDSLRLCRLSPAPRRVRRCGWLRPPMCPAWTSSAPATHTSGARCRHRLLPHACSLARSLACVLACLLACLLTCLLACKYLQPVSQHGSRSDRPKTQHVNVVDGRRVLVGAGVGGLADVWGPAVGVQEHECMSACSPLPRLRAQLACLRRAQPAGSRRPEAPPWPGQALPSGPQLPAPNSSARSPSLDFDTTKGRRCNAV